MRQFLRNTILFISLICFSIYLVFLKVNGSNDPYYLRFTVPKQNSLILGTSQAAQGVLPSVLNNKLNRTDLFNYSFSISHRPYGLVYLNSIKKKLNNSSKEGLFILTIDPWSLSANKKNPNDSSLFKENDKFLGTTNFVNCDPNVEYLFENYGRSYIHLFESNDKVYLHKDGWLEVSPRMDEKIILKRIKEKIDFYKETKLDNSSFSETRYSYLLKTISFLKKHGEVYLIRLPVHPKMMELETQLMPDFNNKIKEAINNSQDYYDMSHLNGEFKYTDGNHLFKESGMIVSELIAKRIKLKSNFEK